MGNTAYAEALEKDTLSKDEANLAYNYMGGGSLTKKKFEAYEFSLAEVCIARTADGFVTICDVVHGDPALLACVRANEGKWRRLNRELKVAVCRNQNRVRWLP